MEFYRLRFRLLLIGTAACGRTEPLARVQGERLLTAGADAPNLVAAKINAERQVSIRKQKSA